MGRREALIDFLDSPEGGPLRARFVERVMPKGALFRDQDSADRVFIVRSGRVRVFLTTGERELSLSYLGPGDIFSTHTRAEIEAVEDARLLLASRSALESELERHPPLRAAIIRVLARVLNQAMTMIEDLAFHDVRGRIARFLLRCAARDGASAPGASIDVHLAMDELAALLGASRQTVSTELNALVREGAIARDGRKRLVLRDLARLRAIAGEDREGS